MKAINVTYSSMPEINDFIEEITSLWDTHWLTNMGEKHKKLQSLLKGYLNVENIELFTNGHMALELAIQALDLKGEIITTPYTFASTTHAIVRNDCKPIFCDINQENFTIDVNKIESLITDKTVAIMPVHVYGNICNIEKINKIAKKYNLKVIYDAAHAFGEKYKGVDVGQFGDVSCFSFHATKVFNTIEGGCACFRNKELGRRLYNLKNFGIRDEETVESVGSNAKMNEFCAAMGICNLKNVNSNINKRKEIVNLYDSLLKNIDGIITNKWDENVLYNYSYYPIIVNKNVFGYSRDEVFVELKKNNIIARKYFYPIITEFDCYKDHNNSNDFPIAQSISNNVITLPIYPELEAKFINKICNIIKSFNN